MVRGLYQEWKRWAAVLGIVIGVYMVFRFCLPVIVPFLFGWLLAVWIHPASVKIERKTHIGRGFTGPLFLFALAGTVGFLLYKGAMELLEQIKTAAAQYSRFLAWGEGFLDQCCRLLEKAAGIPKEAGKRYVLEQLGNIRGQLLDSAGPDVIVSLAHGIQGILTVASAAAIILISGLLFLKDMDAWRKKIWDYPMLCGLRRVARRLKKTTAVYFKAQAVIMAVTAALCAFGFWMMKSPYYLILGLGLGLLDALPLIGTGTFLYPAAFLFFLKGNLKMAAACVALDIVTSLVREFLEPRLLGEKLGVHPVIVLGAVYVGFFVYGPLGFLLGPLSLSVMYEIGKEWEVWE